MQEPSLLVFQILVLIFSVVIHEVSHGSMAYALGDTTAKDLGRLTLNPLPHLDLMGSLVVPLLLVLSHAGFMLGWAKPVPYNPNNLIRTKWAEPLVAFAGPGANLVIAILFGALIRVFHFSHDTLLLLQIVIYINLLLAVFNLVPIPPLDGSKILFALLPYQFHETRRFLEQYGFVLLILLILVGFPFIGAITLFLFNLLV